MNGVPIVAKLFKRERINVFDRLGNQYKFYTLMGKWDRSIKAVCIAVVVLPSSCVTTIPYFCCLIFIHGAFIHM